MTTHTDLIANLRSRHRLMYHASPIPSVMTEAADALESLEQQVAALRVDAERYRWLRERHWVEGETRFRLNLMQATSDHEADMLELDSAIDAAMGEK